MRDVGAPRRKRRRRGGRRHASGRPKTRRLQLPVTSLVATSEDCTFLRHQLRQAGTLSALLRRLRRRGIDHLGQAGQERPDRGIAFREPASKPRLVPRPGRGPARRPRPRRRPSTRSPPWPRSTKLGPGRDEELDEVEGRAGEALRHGPALPGEPRRSGRLRRDRSGRGSPPGVPSPAAGGAQKCARQRSPPSW